VNANSETLPSNGDEVARAIDAIAETMLLNDGEGSINGNDDDVVVAEESVLRRDKQAIVSWMDDEGDGAAVIYFSRRRRRAIRRRLRKNLNKCDDEPSEGSISVEIIGKRGRNRKTIVSSNFEEDDKNDGFETVFLLFYSFVIFFKTTTYNSVSLSMSLFNVGGNSN
jgi:hypothetical protein